jgi:tetrahydromethanopterin S-methyltransferase subunit D
MNVHVGTRTCACVCVFLTCCSVVTLRAVEFAPVGGIKMPMCIGLGVAATATHKVKMLVGLQLRLRLA